MLACGVNCPPAEVPPCHCGAPRKFEFQVGLSSSTSPPSRTVCEFFLLYTPPAQILPQLLNHITNTTFESLDFASVYVYTCTASCERQPASEAWTGNYCLEYAWVQVDTSKMVAPAGTEAAVEAKDEEE